MGHNASCESGDSIGFNSTNATANTLDVADDFAHYLFWSIEEMQTILWPIFLYLMGIIYTFFAIAIICDEFFVPALERITDRFKIHPNIAGATLMAAGGSAPELATSFVGTFSDSAVGFGTIVGSAVFNVLFVIGVCAFLSTEVLELSYWPLFRDASVYIVSLAVLALFFGGITRNRITWYESLCLLLMYIGYCVLMSQNDRLNQLADKLVMNCKRLCPSSSVAAAKLEPRPPLAMKMNFSVGINRVLLGKRLSKRAGWFAVTRMEGDAMQTFAQIDTDNDRIISKDEFSIFMRNLGHPPTEEELKSVFLDFNSARPDHITHTEFLKWYMRSELRLHRSLVRKFMTWDHDHDALLTCGQLSKLLLSLGITDETKAMGLASEVFNSRRTPMGPLSPHPSLGDDASATASKDEVLTLIDISAPTNQKRDSTQSCDEDCNKGLWAGSNAIVNKPSSNGHFPRIAFGDFKKWLNQNPEWTTQLKNLQHSDDDDDDDNDPLWIEWPTLDTISGHHPCKLFSARLMFCLTLPLVLLFVFTVPDTRRAPRTIRGRVITWSDWWLPSFVLSISWIAVFSYLMVWWAEVLGKISTLPPTFIGLTLLAAGTSIPDLISSVIVARKGKGDMAVSSSIGSNIFDILIGLPLPWFAFSLYHGIQNFGACVDPTGASQPNEFCFSAPVVAETLLFSVILLIAMIGVVISIVACAGWRMTKVMGISMLVLYAVFVLQDVLRNCSIVPSVARHFRWLS